MNLGLEMERNLFTLNYGIIPFIPGYPLGWVYLWKEAAETARRQMILKQQELEEMIVPPRTKERKLTQSIPAKWLAMYPAIPNWIIFR